MRIKDFNPIKIDDLIELSIISIPIFIPVGNKYIKYADSTNITEEMHRLKKKGLGVIYLNEQGFKEYLTIKKSFLAKNYNALKSDKTQPQILTSLMDAERSIQEIGNAIGLDRETQTLMSKISEDQITTIKKYPDLSRFMNNLPKEKSPRAMREMLLKFLCVKTFEAMEFTDYSLELITLGLMIRGLNMDEEEYWANLQKPLPEQLSQRPQEILEHLPCEGAFINGELRHFIQLQNYRLDGSGFPKKMSIHKLNALNAVYMICEEFLNIFIKHNLKNNKIKSILNTLEKDFIHQTNPIFKKAFNAFKNVLQEHL